MKKFLMLFAVLAVLGMASMASAEVNGQAQAQGDIVKSASTASVTAVVGRIANMVAPAPRPGGTAPGGPKVQGSLTDGSFKFAMNAQDLGLASGDDANVFGVWGMGAYTNFKSTASGGKYDADAYNLFIGADMRVTPELLIGVAGGWGNLDLDKKEWGADNGSIKTDNEWTIMPYLAYNITPNLIFDGAFSYSNGEYKDSNSTDSGTYSSNRYLTSLGLSYYYNVDAWTLSGRAGYFYVNGDLGKYSRNGVDVANPDTYLGQATLEAKAAYMFAVGAQPYASLRYMYDVQTSSTPVGSDYDEFEGVLGLNWYTGDWTINLEGGASMGRDKYDAYRGQAYIRYEF